MPNGPPALLTACSTAEPTPLCSSVSSPSAAEVAVAMAMPVPTPAITIQTATNSPLDPTLVVAPTSNPAARRLKPALQHRRADPAVLFSQLAERSRGRGGHGDARP